MNIPRPDHPVWRRLVNGEVLFQPSFLGACMFLAHVRAGLREHGAGDRTALFVERLRRLYAQNRDCESVRRDLARLRMNEIYMPDPDCAGWFHEEPRSAALNIPPPEHPVWHRLVNGELPFQPSFLGACMLLTHVRADGRRPGGERRAVQLRALYAQNRHSGSARSDLVRLRVNEIFTADPDCSGWFREEARSERVAEVPPADHPVWRGLVTGEETFQPSFLGACMLLAHVRADLRQPGGRSRAGVHVGQLRSLYAHNVECGSVQRDLLRLRAGAGACGRPAAPARGRRVSYMIPVVAIDGREHHLPADTVTRDEPTPGPRGPYIPLAFRVRGEVFYVCTARWSELAGVALRLESFHRARGRRPLRGALR
jgi:hypothetical protein